MSMSIPCCDYRDHSSGACACPEHPWSEDHPFGVTELRDIIRTYLVANMGDGGDGGSITMPAKTLFDEASQLAAEVFVRCEDHDHGIERPAYTVKED